MNDEKRMKSKKYRKTRLIGRYREDKHVERSIHREQEKKGQNGRYKNRTMNRMTVGKRKIKEFQKTKGRRN